VLRGRPGDDVIEGGEGRDVIWVGSGADREFGGPGNDVLHALANDRQVDLVDCGAGNHDVAWLNAAEQDQTAGCEVVKTIQVTAAQAAEDDR
jgi:Ca2+-binding RTX toxin-like protein